MVNYLALTAASNARMRQLTNKGDKRAKIVENLRLIGSNLIGNNAVNVLGPALATSFAIALFGEAVSSGRQLSKRFHCWCLPSQYQKRKKLR